MSRLLCLPLVLLVGCHQGPDFSEPAQVIAKSSTEQHTVYHLQHDRGVRGAGWGAVKMAAPQDFADVGDVLVIESGALVVRKVK
jgi:hypothetical protein